MKHRRLRNMMPLLIIFVIVVLAFESGLIVIPMPPTRVTFQLGGHDMGVGISEKWEFFDKNGAPLVASNGRTYSSSSELTLSFALPYLPYQYVTLDKSKLGYIAVRAVAELENDMPTQLSPSDPHASSVAYAAFFLTRQLTGVVSINGAPLHGGFPDMEFVPPEYVPTSLDNFNMLSGLELQASAVFMSGDKDGKRLISSFFIITTPGLSLEQCTKYARACVNLSSQISEGKDFKIGATFTDKWKAWVIELPKWNPIPPQLGGVNWDAYWKDCAYIHRISAYQNAWLCTLAKSDMKEVHPYWEAMISEFCVLENGTCRLTKTETTPTQLVVTISQTLTGDKWIIVRKYSFTTVTDTMTVSAPADYPGCPTIFGGEGNPLATLMCESWNGWPYWLIALGVILMVAFIYAPKPQRGGLGVVINLAKRAGGSRRREEEEEGVDWEGAL